MHSMKLKLTDHSVVKEVPMLHFGETEFFRQYHEDIIGRSIFWQNFL